MSIAHNLSIVKDNIKQACLNSGRSEEEIKIIAVTKYVDVSRIKEALHAGLTDIGESRVQDAVPKWEQTEGKGNWHFIGHLQTNKVKDIIDKFDFIHSLDRSSLAKEIHKRAHGQDKLIKCFVQVNVSGEESKHGLSLEKVEAFIEQLAQYPTIRVIGLMTMAPYEAESEETRPVFSALKALQLSLQKKGWSHAPLNELSMGMSNDYTIAIEEGATYIRLGTKLVGDS